MFHVGGVKHVVIFMFPAPVLLLVPAPLTAALRLARLSARLLPR